VSQCHTKPFVGMMAKLITIHAFYGALRLKGAVRAFQSKLTLFHPKKSFFHPKKVNFSSTHLLSTKKNVFYIKNDCNFVNKWSIFQNLKNFSMTPSF